MVFMPLRAAMRAKLTASVVLPSPGTDDVTRMTFGFLSTLESISPSCNPRTDSVNEDIGLSMMRSAALNHSLRRCATSGIVERTGTPKKLSSCDVVLNPESSRSAPKASIKPRIRPAGIEIPIARDFLGKLGDCGTSALEIIRASGVWMPS